MLYRRSYLAVASAIALIIGCRDNLPTTPTLTEASSAASVGTKKNGATLTAPFDETIGATHLVGVIRIMRFDQDDAGALLASGVISGTANGVAFTQTFSKVPAALESQADPNKAERADAESRADVGTSVVTAQQVATCDILLLDLGPLHLDILGLVVDLSQVVLNIDAVAGAGNLLGNLLCAIVHLLDGPALFTAVANLLEQVNAILAAL